jgi:hypothetical protein
MYSTQSDGLGFGTCGLGVQVLGLNQYPVIFFGETCSKWANPRS